MVIRTVFCTLLLFGLVSGCGSDDPLTPEPGNPTELAATGVSELNEFSVWNEFADYGDCFDGGRGDTIHGQGILHVELRSVDTPSGIVVSNIKFRWDDGFTMVGLESGHSYTLVGATNIHQHIVEGDGLYVAMNMWRFRVRDDVTGDVYDWPVRVHLTWNANGDLTAVSQAFPCQPIPGGN